MTVTDLAPPTTAATVVGTLSPSRASDFMACPLLYRFRVIDRLPERPSAVATRGTMVHAVLERLFDLPPSERTLDQAALMLQPEWERLVEAEPELGRLFEDEPEHAEDPDTTNGAGFAGWMASAVDLLRCYFTLEDPRRLQPADREVYVETVLDSGLALRGYVDRIDISASGDVRVVDYKTGRAPAENFEARALFQMRFYALVVWRLRGVVPRMLQLLYLGSGEVLRYEPDEADLRATERKLLALWTAISRAMETGDWRPSPSRICDWCDHRERCPAFGGTPPPLTVGEGMEPGQRDGVLDVPSPRSRPDEV
jgi:putative RecB family exonuclease